ncbi:MAG: ABC-F family ATP-binding cassette domain-containing protein [Bacteroidetes bacterium]|nr:ABC-F family ATP-binding cassette domain-containing protein [Bacteroidota bacterium]
MNYLSVENLSVNFGEKVLFEDLTFGLSKGDKVALIANNGVGKSTLLKILAGKDIPNSGTIEVRNGIKIGFLAQAPDFNEDITINELIGSFNPTLIEVIREYEKAADEQAANFSPATKKTFVEAMHVMDASKAWDYERRLKQILTKFNITGLDQKVGELSGGQKKRLALGMALLDSPDILLLDEPTNHLDLDMIEWLEGYLSQSHITIFMVTHDRYFLDRICNHIIEMEDRKIYHHDGNYEYFLEKREEREIAMKTEISKAQKLMKKELEWLRRQPKARTTKSKARIDAYYEIEKVARSGKKERRIKLDVKMSRLGGKILELKKVSKSYGDLKILTEFDYTFKRGDRIGILGNNGVGKSTFLNIITGLVPADSGQVIPGDTIVYGYYTQNGLEFKPDRRVIDIMTDAAEVITLSNGNQMTASQFLEFFMFPHKMQRTLVEKLSGGEKRRLYLLTILIKNPNFLILDEPTNDLDLLVLNKLEEFLINYPGCLMLVSHDRYFLDKLADHLFVFKGDGEILDYYDTCSSYRQSMIEAGKLERTQTSSKNREKKKSATRDKPTKRVTYKEKYEHEQLEKQIELLEEEKKILEKDMELHAIDAEKMLELSDRYNIVNSDLDKKTDRWLELSEKIEQS